MRRLVEFVLVALGVAALPAALSLADGAAPVTFAVAMIALVGILLVVATHARTLPLGTTRAHPLRAMDVSAPLDQSDPDAPGHPRPRAPQSAVTAA